MNYYCKSHRASNFISYFILPFSCNDYSSGCILIRLHSKYMVGTLPLVCLLFIYF
jgi:hypothetical protein